MIRTILTGALTGVLMALLPASAEARQQPYFCPAPEDVWIMDKEFPEAPGWRHEARVRGNATINGLGMLLHQGIPAWKSWFNIEPVITTELRQMLEKSIPPDA